MGTGDGVLTDVVEGVAEREGVDPTELEPPLYDVIDPDALDAIVDETGGRPEGSVTRVNFTYNGYAVTIDDAREVTVRQSTRGDRNGSARGGEPAE